ncbi:hypothetical protein DV096_03240 [Bradymonadaceae bacterium TMQ3]|uniref:Saccharopine dehydrogenase NADP binding domain-containing protein n=1 Tax=Lujinxingia sediminis TaxID=2480984 RepID=A0ABY0CWT0_9DELT|nr:saccharopine dehydrogenase NADP-binding domain-containing protein [Lujinxingia sediminis]RDV39597.1 hypothetical protein DV096_03240 [Bradymonadaceae bacterium TMQ3]RVU48357.1 hypothetical protein EA187_02665 [Lujinxingia sediminis]TXC77659.1 hypothetical protein FRC91_02680 [Bradymonadales bacterium TMQ1]
MDPIIAIYGASGFVGRMLARTLSEGGRSLRLIGRDLGRLEELEEELRADGFTALSVRQARLSDATGLRGALRDCCALVNCAGPLGNKTRALVQAALDEGVHVFDMAGEQSQVHWMWEHVDQPARERGLVVMPACAIEYAVGDFAAEIALVKAASRIVVCYAVREIKLSQGARKTFVHALGEGGYSFIDGKLEQHRAAYRLFDVPFPGGHHRKGVWIPGAEAIFVPPRGGVSRVESCVVTGEAVVRILATLSGVLPSVLRALRPVADRIVEQGDESDASDASLGEYLVIAFDPRTSEPYAMLTGEDVYATSVRIAAECVCRTLDEGPVKVGVTSPAAVFDAQTFLASVGVRRLH